MEALSSLVAKPIRRTKIISNPLLSNSLFTSTKTCCSNSNNTSKQPQQNGDDSEDKKKGDKFSIDWDKAWKKQQLGTRKKGRSSPPKSLLSPNKYVTWNPRRSNYPLSEEVDPIKRTERSNLMLWTSPKFTLGGAIVIVSLLLLYTLLAPIQ